MAATPNCQTVEAAVLAAFPDARFGRYNCRHIGSNPLRSWSQHAGSEPDRRYFSNALDIWHVDHKPPGKPADSSLVHQTWLRAVRGFITLNYGVLIDQMLGPGDNRAHANHIHISTWPKMKSNFWYRPPCKGGTLVVINEDGTKGDTFGDVVPPPLPSTLEYHMAYADTLNLKQWVATLRDEDIDQLFALGVHSPDTAAARDHWKRLLAAHPNAANTDSWEGFRRTTSARIGFWQPEAAGTIVRDASSYKLIGDITPT